MADAAPDETALRAAFDAGDFERVAALALDSHGESILRFLAAYLGSDADAHEVFGDFCERLWKGLPGFGWRTTLRAWSYTIARHAAIDRKTAAHRRPGRQLPLSASDAMARAAEQARSRTAAHLRTDMKDRIRELRERLEPDDQALIILRVDRGLSWREIAEVLGAPQGADLGRQETRLRKRFQLAKDRLRVLARDAGLLRE